ncbi:MAG: hypothetical protein GWO07_10880 [Candidatus Dadabacteria bacterium]|nr:hypothetical protein [Candidatus Dadabacteria bacterium]NIS09244.1 hypothetical protein [Candidatus Dadabacteria bacterium]NIV41892.1 hypothetical protein [Candidatus Dadabacteria bacterium]NIX15790.1 hypothetical protein [Candidatus Dadabacteria bacterium]NIY22520.1 hypothetical protein [Candidatus Dadabacteria bacterium]
MNTEKLEANISKLETLIARKPATEQYKAGIRITDSFSKYTRTSLINILVSFSELPAEREWAFPSYLLRNLQLKNSIFSKLHIYYCIFIILYKALGIKKLVHAKVSKVSEFEDKDWTVEERNEDLYNFIEILIMELFNRNNNEIFEYWKNSSIFEGKEDIIDQVSKFYNNKYWIANISTAFPLLDHLFRSYFNTR